MKLKHLLTTIALTLGATLIPKGANSYAVKSENGDPSIHPLLVEKLKELYQPPTGVKFNTKTVKQGAIEEDSPESVYTRSYNHFISWENPNDGLWDFPSSKKWAQSPELQSGPIPFDKFPEPLRAYYVALYSGTEGIYPYGDNSWPRVKDDYAQGEIGIPFGHIFHLICDATVPAHVRMDPHFGDSAFLEQLTEGSYFQVSLWPSDAYEVWTDEHKGKIMDWLAPKKENIPQFDSLGALFDNLAKFTGSNFYSDDRVDGTVKDLEEITEGKKVYFMKEVDGKYVHVLRKGFFSDFPDIKCLEDEWMVLGTKSLEYGAAALELLAKEACKSECSQNGQMVCDGNGWKGCEDFNDDGCLEWSEIHNCLNTEYCGEGACHAAEIPDTISYPDTYISPDTYVSSDAFTQICTPGKIETVSTCWNGATKEFKKCSSDGTEWNYGTDDCWHSDCEGSVCMPTKGDTPDTCIDDWDCEGCVNECFVEESYCKGNNIMICYDKNNDSCLEEVFFKACEAGYICDNKEGCVPSCEDDIGCSYNGQMFCSGNFPMKCSTYFDDDECLDSYNADNDCSWNGEICKDGECVTSCTDECVYNPATVGLYCEGNKIMLCGYYQEDKCLTGDVFIDCGSGKTCVDLECVDICTGECETVGWYCESNKVMFCDNYDTDTCLEKKIGETCAPNEVCTPEWGCEESCTPECTVAENKTCSGSNYIECYNKDADSCLEKTVKACAAGTTCTTGIGCVVLTCNDTTCQPAIKYTCGEGTCWSEYQCVNNSCECKDSFMCEEKIDGYTYCNNSSTAALCTDVNSDGCLDRKHISCISGTTCKNGVCVGDCTPECTAAENKTCSGSNYIECYDKDADSCLEKTVKACTAGTTCTVGKGCEASCEDDCWFGGDQAGESICTNIATQAYDLCDDFDGDSCLETETFTCPVGTVCINTSEFTSICKDPQDCVNECIPSAPDVDYEKYCDGKKVMVCGNLDSDYCYDKKLHQDCSTLGNNYVCASNAVQGYKCEKECVPTITSPVCYQGDVYYGDDCGNIKSFKEACSDFGPCIPPGICQCPSHWSSNCKDSDVYWKDGCNNWEEKKEECGANGCADKACVGGGTCDIKSGCSDADCVFYDDFSGGSLDTICKWDTEGAPKVVGIGGYLTLKGTSDAVGTKSGIFDNTPCNGGDFTLKYGSKLLNQDSANMVTISGILGPLVYESTLSGDTIRLYCEDKITPDAEITGMDLTTFHNVTLKGSGVSLTLTVDGVGMDGLGKSVTKSATCSSFKELLSVGMHSSLSANSEVQVDHIKIICK